MAAATTFEIRSDVAFDALERPEAFADWSTGAPVYTGFVADRVGGQPKSTEGFLSWSAPDPTTGEVTLTHTLDPFGQAAGGVDEFDIVFCTGTFGQPETYEPVDVKRFKVTFPAFEADAGVAQVDVSGATLYRVDNGGVNGAVALLDFTIVGFPSGNDRVAVHASNNPGASTYFGAIDGSYREVYFAADEEVVLDTCLTDGSLFGAKRLANYTIGPLTQAEIDALPAYTG